MPARRARATALLAALVIVLALAPGSPAPTPVAAQVASPSAAPDGLVPATSSPGVVDPSRQRPAPDPFPAPVRPPPGSVAVQPDVAAAGRHDVSPRLATLRPPDAAEARTHTPPDRRRSSEGLSPRSPRAAAVDPVLQQGRPLGSMPPPLLSFEGVSNADNIRVARVDAVPPDPTGDVGPNHYVHWVNLSFAIYTRTGERVFGPVPGNTLFAGFGGPCETTNDGDPIVLYDHLADRWLLSQFAIPNDLSGPYYQCVAVSRTSDPTGAYARYEFVTSTTKLNDYPKFGVWPDGYYLSYNQYRNGLFLEGAGLGVLEREAMLAGAPARIVTFDLQSVDPRFFGFLPADLDGPSPPADAPGLFVAADDDVFGWPDDRIQIFELRTSWANPAATRLDGPLVLPTAPFDSELCFFFRSCIPQPNTTSRLDAISDRLMWRLQYRDFGDYEMLLANHTVDVDGTDRAGIRWYELRRSGGQAWSIYQQGTYSPDPIHRWVGSMAMDRQSNVALGFSIASRTLFPSIHYVGRLADDPLGTLPRAEQVLVQGAGSQTSFTARWGDYTHLAVDPLDDCTFYYTNQYYSATASRAWQTRVGTFRFPSCVAPAAPGGGTDAPTATIDSVVRAESSDEDTPKRLTEEQRQQRERTNQLGQDDYRTEGNVVGVRCSPDAPVPPDAPAPELDEDVPYVLIATRDGLAKVRLLRDARATCLSVQVGDYLEAEGTKQHEALFEADDVATSRP